MKIHADFTKFVAVGFDASKYVASPAYGVNRFMLDRIGSERARATTIVEYKPDSKFPEHTHIGGEEFIVLKGTFEDQHGKFPVGTYVRNNVGSKHAPWVGPEGCTIMVKLLQMADPASVKDTRPLYVRYDDDKDRSTKTRYGSFLDMYDNQFTGEHVQMCWIDPDAIFHTGDSLANGGEELFIIDGSLCLGGDEQYTKWGWLRFPVGTTESEGNRSTLKAGSEGAQVYRKTGHLTEKALSMEKIQISDE